MKGFRRRITVMLALVLLLTCGQTAMAAGEINTQATGSLRVYFGDSGKHFTGAAFSIYRVAEVSAEGTFSHVGYFAQYKDTVVLNGLNSDGWRALAQTLDAYVARDKPTPLRTVQTESDGWAAFSDLAPGLYLVTGEKYVSGRTAYVPETFLACIPGVHPETGKWIYDVEVSVKFNSTTSPPEEDGTIDRKVLKVWRDDGDPSKRPERIRVQLLRDGRVYDTVTLSEENNWRYTWTGLDDDFTWRVVEAEVPEGYTVSVQREGITFVLTNTYLSYTPSDPPSDRPSGNSENKLPQTGSLWWPVPLLLCGGILLLILGWGRRRHAR